MNLNRFALIAISISSFAASPLQSQTTVEASIQTVGGTLEILREVKSPKGFPDYRIVLNGKTLLEPDSQIRDFVAEFPQNGPAQLILVETTSGGSGCPYSHQVIEVSANGTAHISSDIGGCFLLVDKPIYKSGEWILHFYPIQGSFTDTWVYRKGRAVMAPKLRIRVPKRKS